LSAVLIEFLLLGGLGTSIHACKFLSRHIIALEEDKEIFDAVLAPMIRSVPDVPTTVAPTILVSDDEDAVEVQVLHIMKKSRFGK